MQRSLAAQQLLRLCLAILVWVEKCVLAKACASGPARSDRPSLEQEKVQLHTFVLRPFWWPMNMKEMPSMEARPHTMAGSSSPALSPCSSTNLHMPHPTSPRIHMCCRPHCNNAAAAALTRHYGRFLPLQRHKKC